eukprot:CAMPEP_0117062248 /NCGR_PEP_ID=MMETSP0472-20121206/43364_1 /TAXON_ID=693140 ORGANISM="Tiarina fusus, Strain LIS" /NCGR_SAMPLE_ID=MMETSP0472 /ASSEMBLY_ACC=CAM_ASM_000603 /LENGTH=680 /DNA_ID=CAMNT_0004781299 /DNA_START=665 /DNA_END=2707 /DNA_ORIENTATION=+
MKTLFVFHKKFFKKLESLKENAFFPMVLPLGATIKEACAELRSIYLSYSNDYVPRVETLRHLKTTVSRFHHFIEEQEQKGYALEELYELPLQYLPVLAAQLRIVHACSCPSVDDETMALGRTIGIVESIELTCTKILDEQQSPEVCKNIKQTLIVELSLKGLENPLLGTPKRTLMKEGPLRISKKKTTCHLYLFNDMMITAERIANSLQNKYLQTIYPYEVELEPIGTKLQLQITQANGNVDTELFSFKGSRSTKAEWLKTLNEFVENYKKNRVFGMPLEEIIEREQIPERIPFVMAISMIYIREYGLSTEGIFRVPGDGFIIETNKRLFDTGATEVDFRGCSVHDVAGLLKLYLRKLPEPLFPYKHYPTLVSIQNQYEEGGSEEEYSNSIAVILTTLSPCSRHVFLSLVEFLQEVCKHEKVTKMGVKNIAMVFTPNVMRPRSDNINTAMQSLVIAKLFEYILEESKKLFARATELDASFGIPFAEKVSAASKKKSRYSMDAFDPLLCNEIPVPGTLDSGKLNLRLPLRTSFRKAPKTRFAAKISPRKDLEVIKEELLSLPVPNSEAGEFKCQWRKSRSMNALNDSIALFEAQALQDQENATEKQEVIEEAEEAFLLRIRSNLNQHSRRKRKSSGEIHAIKQSASGGLLQSFLSQSERKGGAKPLPPLPKPLPPLPKREN